MAMVSGTMKEFRKAFITSVQLGGAALSVSFTGSVFGADNSFSSVLVCGVRNFCGSLVVLN